MYAWIGACALFDLAPRAKAAFHAPRESRAAFAWRISESGLPDADMIAGEVYDFGPDGTTFETPVTLEAATR